MSDESFDRVERFRSACAEWGLAMPQVATAWVLANPAVTSAIVGASKPEQVADAVAAADLQLTAEQLQTLDRIFTAARG
jgi:aryl-alcohol dehydrogenase-like predicted oxidoreductase